MESIDDDEFLAGLAPPSIKAATSNALRRNSDDTLPRTPPLAATNGSSMLGRKTGADATSTLLDFLKQEQAMATEQLPKSPMPQLQRQQKELTGVAQDEPHHATNMVAGGSVRPGTKENGKTILGSQLGPAANNNSSSPPPPPPPLPAAKPISPVKQSANNSHAVSAAAAAAETSAAPQTAALPLGAPTGRVSALRQQLEAGSFAAVPALSGRRAACDGAAGPAPTAAAKPAVKHFDSWDLDDDMLPDGSGVKASATTGGRSSSNADDADENLGSRYMPSFAPSNSNSNSNSHRVRINGSTAAAASPDPAASIERPAAAASTSMGVDPGDLTAAGKLSDKQDNTEKQQVASQMAAALVRRAQLNQQQQQNQQPQQQGSPAVAGSSSNNPAARTLGSPALTASDTSSSMYQYGSPLSATSNRLAAATARSAEVVGPAPAANVFSVIGNPAYSPTVSPQANIATSGDSTTAASGASRGVSFSGGGLLAKGLAELGITDASPVTTAYQHQPSTISSANTAAGSWPAVAGHEGQLYNDSVGLPPGVTPMAGRPGTATVPSCARPDSASPAACNSSAAAAAEVLSTLTTSGNGRNAGQGSSQTRQQQQQQLPQLQQSQKPQDQKQLVQQPSLQQQQQDALLLTATSQPQAQLAQPARLPLGDFDSQLTAVRQLASLQQELADQKLTIARLRQQADEDHVRHQSEVARLRSDLEAAQQKAAADAAAARDNLAKEIAAAEARAQRAACLERDVACAQIQAQAAAIAQEREALAAQRMNAEVLTSLSEKVRDAAAANAERESRALAALERSSAERAAALVARERRLQEREEAVSGREHELDELKSQLGKVLAGLEDQAAADKGLMEAQTARLARESARLEALQAALLSERDEAKLTITLEKQALEEARAARIKEREAFIAEVTAERRRLAEEAASTARAAEEARANLLDLKGRVADYEASAAAALRQTREEEARAAAVRRAVADEQDKLAATQKELKAASRRLEDDRSQLQEWAARLAVLTREFDAAKEEVKAARTEIQTQRNTLTNQVAALMTAQEQLEAQRQVIMVARMDLDRQRVLIAEERAALSRERIAASQAATTPGAIVPHSQAALLSLNRYQLARPQTSPAVCDGTAVVQGGGQLEQQPRSISAGRKASIMGRNSLRKLMEELQLHELADQGSKGSSNRCKRLSSTVKAQREFLDQLKAASATNVWSSPLAALGSSLPSPVGYGVFGGAAGAHDWAAAGVPASPTRRPSGPSRVPVADGQRVLLVAATGPVGPGSPAAKQSIAANPQDALLLLQRLAQLQQATGSQLGALQGDTAAELDRMSRHSSTQQQKQQVASDLLQQQQQRRHSSQRRRRQHKHGSASRVSSDLSQMIALSISGSDEVEDMDSSEVQEWQQHS